MSDSTYRLHPIWQVTTPGEVALWSPSMPDSLADFLQGGEQSSEGEVLSYEAGLQKKMARTARRLRAGRVPARWLRRG